MHDRHIEEEWATFDFNHVMGLFGLDGWDRIGFRGGLKWEHAKGTDGGGPRKIQPSHSFTFS